jgi:NADH-quinone oxidoreductase subunit J
VESFLFWIFAAGVVIAGAQVVLRRNPIHGALALVGCFFFLAGVYVLLAAHLIAILQIMVYAGAVMVLFVFVIMLLNLREEELGEPRLTAWKGVGLVAVLAATGVLAWRALGAAYAGRTNGRGLDMASAVIATSRFREQALFGTLKAVGRAIYLDSVLAFEVTSLLLLVAVVGAVVVAKGKI